MAYLSKSDYKVSHNCPTKLFYKKMKYPSVMDGDEYLQFLAKGGYAVGKLATLYYPNGIEITSGIPLEAEKETNELLKKEEVTLFEAAILSGKKLIRVDILEKNGNHINLIEVKSKSYDPTSKKGLSDSSFKDYLFDIGFQYLTVKERFPQYTVKPFLMMPDKSKHTAIEGLSFNFTIKEIPTGTTFRKYEVAVDEKAIPQITNENILTLVNVEPIISGIIPEIKKELEILLPSLENGVSKIETQLSKDCFKCEYSTTDQSHSKSGFDECWKDYKPVEHHLKELYHIGTIGGNKNPRANQLIKLKKISLFDITEADLSGKRGERQIIQLKCTKENKIHFDPQLKRTLNSLQYPLHFIDFETTRAAIPFHKGMRPYEQLTFQWSCHTIQKPGDEPSHSEWLNLDVEYPNFKFAESLMNQIGNVGTPLMWSPFENSTLKDVYKQILKMDFNNPELRAWLEQIIKFNKVEEEIVPKYLLETDGRFVDLAALTMKYYFHPYMQGRTSIKKVLPAVLQSVNSLRIEKWLKDFEPDLSLYALDENNYIQDPYKQLPPLQIYEDAEKLSDDAEESYVVNEGTGAMTAYQDIMIGLNKGNMAKVKEYENALKRYCKLDTLAMVIIWEYWMNYKN